MDKNKAFIVLFPVSDFDTACMSGHLTRVRAQVSFESGVAGERPLAVATDIAVHAGVDLHVLLQGLLRLEALCTQQTEHRHVSPWRTHKTQLFQYRALSGETGSLQLCVSPLREKLLSKSKCLHLN